MKNYKVALYIITSRTLWAYFLPLDVIQCSDHIIGQGHHRPVIASNFRQVDPDSPSKKPATIKRRSGYLAG
jgi:hypothetical protein